MLNICLKQVCHMHVGIKLNITVNYKLSDDIISERLLHSLIKITLDTINILFTNYEHGFCILQYKFINKNIPTSIPCNMF